jgi:hypothetical protein
MSLTKSGVKEKEMWNTVAEQLRTRGTGDAGRAELWPQHPVDKHRLPG